MFDAMSSNYNAYLQELLSPASLGTPSNLGLRSTGVDPQQMSTAPGENVPDLPNAQGMIDGDTLAMWSNAPSGFEYDIPLSDSHPRCSFFVQPR